MHQIVALTLAGMALVLMVMPETDAAVSCYQCITSKTSWNKEKCAKSTIKTGCSFCTKASFGGALTIRSCAKAGTTKMYKDLQKTCSTYNTVYAGLKANDAFKTNWNKKMKYYEASCPKTNTGKTREPIKVETCTKKDCNSAPKTVSLSTSVVLAVTAFLGANAAFRWQH